MPNLPKIPLVISMWVIFAMIVVFFWVSKWLQNGGCVPSEWYRNSFGIVFRPNGACISKLASAKLQREEGESKFFAILWCFEMLKSAHFPSVYGEKFIFLCCESVQFSKCHLTQKCPPCKIDDWRPKSPKQWKKYKVNKSYISVIMLSFCSYSP